MKPFIASATVEGAHKYAQTIRTGEHRLTADEPAALGGENSGPSPYGLVLSGLGACTSITLRMYAERKGWELGTVTVKLKLFKDGEADHIEREVGFSAPLSDEQRTRLLEICEKTPVTKTLKAGARIETKLLQAP